MITHMTKRLLFCTALAVAPMLATTPLVAASCESLAGLKLSNTTITAAQTVAAGRRALSRTPSITCTASGTTKPLGSWVTEVPAESAPWSSCGR